MHGREPNADPADKDLAVTEPVLDHAIEAVTGKILK